MVGEPAGPHDIPAFVVAASVLVEVFGGRLVWGVGGSEGDVEEEGSVGSHAFGVVHEADGSIYQVFADVVSVFGPAWGFNGVVVVGEGGAELVGFAFEEPVVAVEAAL